MKRTSILLMASLLLAVVVGVGVTARSSASKAVRPIAVEIGQPTIDVPDGFMRVGFHTTNVEQAKSLWKKSFGSLDGFSLEKANTITAIYPNDVKPCGCDIPEAKAQWDGHNCNDCPSIGELACSIDQ